MFPLNTAKLPLLNASAEASPVAVYRDGNRVEGEQKRNEAGIPLWAIRAQYVTATRMEPVTVEVAAPTAPVLPGMAQPLTLNGDVELTVYVRDGRPNFKLIAGSVAAPAGKS